jgi:hypothetical protein
MITVTYRRKDRTEQKESIIEEARYLSTRAILERWNIQQDPAATGGRLWQIANNMELLT